MSELFDPYYKWLGIPPEEQPPDCYRLLGIRQFESDRDVIDSAADARMTFLRSLQGGRYGEQCQQLLNEVAGARLCLLDPQRRAPYDQQLRASIATAASNAASGAANSLPTSVALVRVAGAPVAPAGGIRPVATPVAPVFSPPTVAPSAPPAAGSAAPEATAETIAARRVSRRRRRRASPLSDPIVWTIVATCLLGLLAVVAIVASLAQKGNDAANAKDRADAKNRVVRPAAPKVQGSGRDGAGTGRSEAGAGSGETGSGGLVANGGSDRTGGASVGEIRGVADAIRVGDWWLPPPTQMTAVSEARVRRLEDGSLRIENSQAQDVYEFTLESRIRTIARLRIESLPLNDGVAPAAGDTALLIEEIELAVGPRDDPSLEPAPIALQTIAETRFENATASGGETVSIVSAEDAAAALDGDVETAWKAPLTVRKIAEYALKEPVGDKPGSRVLVRLHVDSQGSPSEPVRRRLRISLSDVEAGSSAGSSGASPAGSSGASAAGAGTITRVDPPSAEKQDAVRAQVEKLYPPSDSSDPQELLSRHRQMRSLAEKSSDAAERFVLLRSATETARDAGDSRALFDTLAELETRYKFNADLPARIQFIRQMAAKAKTADAVDSLLAAGQELLRDAIAEGRYEAAGQLVDEMYQVSQQPFGRRYRKLLFDTQKTLKRIAAMRAEYLEAAKRVKADTGDADAQRTVGYWLCFQRGKWDDGLAALARSSDAELRKLASDELAGPPKDFVERGDRWWQASVAADPQRQGAMKQRAAHWYEQADTEKLTELVRARVVQRTAEAISLPPIGARLLEPSRAVPVGVWTNLLAPLDLKEDVDNGQWERRRESLLVKSPASPASVTAPIEVEGSYLLDVDFTCVEGRDAALAFPVGDRATRLQLAAGRTRVTGLAEIDGKNAARNETATKSRIFPRQRHRVTLAVQVSDGEADIRAELDGKPYLAWQGSIDLLGPGPGWSPAKPQRISLIAAEKSHVTYHAAYLKLVAGQAKLDRPRRWFGQKTSPPPSPDTPAPASPKSP